jgi:hypothetical protein
VSETKLLKESRPSLSSLVGISPYAGVKTKLLNVFDKFESANVFDKFESASDVFLFS